MTADLLKGSQTMKKSQHESDWGEKVTSLTNARVTAYLTELWLCTESSWPAHRKGELFIITIYFWLNFVFSVSTGGWRTHRQNKAVEGGCVQCVHGARWVRGSERGGGGGKTEGGWERAGVSTHHAPGISYLKFSRSAPQKNLPTLPTRTHQGACLRTRSFMREATRETRMKFR